MKYIIVSDSNVLLDQAVNQIRQTNEIEKESMHYFDAEIESSLTEALSEYLSSSIFEDKKLIVLRNFDAFKNKSNTDKKTKLFIEELFQVTTSNILIFTTTKLNTENNIYKKIEENIHEVTVDSPKAKELTKFIKDYLSKDSSSISDEAIKRIIEITEENFDSIVSEIKKLALLNTELDKHMVEENIYDRKGENAFKLLDVISSRNVKEIESLLEKLELQGVHPIMLLQMLMNDLFFTLYMIKLQSKGMGKAQISEEFKMNQWRFNKLWSKTSSIDFEDGLKLFDMLIDIEKSIKSTSPEDPMFYFKARILGYIKKEH